LNNQCESLSQLDAFLASVEQRAYRTALFTTKKSQDALDIVQDAMLQLVQYYRHKTDLEWPLLFQRILQNRIMDWHRSQQKQKRFFWQSPVSDQDDENVVDEMLQVAAEDQEWNPAELISRAQNVERVIKAVDVLPLRQRQAFLLRAWEGFDVEQTAQIMECTAGSVKTHYFRAVQRLQELLEEEFYPSPPTLSHKGRGS
jgi:RNA polymerase sigma-70 factor, ECF subfamily